MSSDKHKSGALKRKIQKEKLVKEAKGLQTIAKFIKFEDKAEVVLRDQNYDMSLPATASCESTAKLKPSGSEVSGSQLTCSSSFFGLVSGGSMQVKKVDITEDIASSECQVNEDTEEINTTDRDHTDLGQDDNECNDNADLGINYDNNSYACDDPDPFKIFYKESTRENLPRKIVVHENSRQANKTAISTRMVNVDPGRWGLLKQHIPLSLQSLSETRWSERLQAESKVVAEAVGISSHFITRKRPSRLPNVDENKIEEKLQLEATYEFKSSVIFPVLDFIMADSNQLKIKTKLLVSKYPKDLADADDLNEEILHMKVIHGRVFHSEKDLLKLLNSIY
ncbi:hypothetical protein PR048_011194 [Dryococelus australis]|uniref:Uncharacterized protein n=1 Tax=Dryococelus australis TaxID=614101 RepID=A0ABQ9HKV9_9NEOP|nr:hypothetical protein PR048_011194 [Dryococelus australis]